LFKPFEKLFFFIEVQKKTYSRDICKAISIHFHIVLIGGKLTYQCKLLF